MRISRSEPGKPGGAAGSFRRLYLRIRSGQIAYLKFILEGYDGLAVLSTMDADSGLVRLLYHASRTRELFSLLRELSPELSRHDEKQ